MADPLPLTFRERIAEAIVARFEAQRAGVGEAQITWDVVSRKPLTKDQMHQGQSLGVYDTSERVTKEIGYDYRALNVVFEFTLTIQDGDDQEVILNATLGEVQRVVGMDIQWGIPDPNNPSGPSYKLALDTVEQGSEIDIGGEKPTIVSGMVIYRILYRTRNGNPFKRG